MWSINLQPLGPAVPARGWPVGRWFGRQVLRLLRWSFEGGIPNVSKAVVIVAPHTSNCDFIVGAAAMFALDLEASFLGKHTLFKGLLGAFMRWLGGIPVDRTGGGTGVVDDMVQRFDRADALILALAPEGTRSAVDRWKTGFHAIALRAAVPVVPVTLDYGRRQIRIAEPFKVTEDIAADTEKLQRFFSDSSGRRSDKGIG
jgi:1-acyl-sn-glycerol-3-phosphate acyltransferase